MYIYTHTYTNPFQITPKTRQRRGRRERIGMDLVWFVCIYVFQADADSVQDDPGVRLIRAKSSSDKNESATVTGSV